MSIKSVEAGYVRGALRCARIASGGTANTVCCTSALSLTRTASRKSRLSNKVRQAGRLSSDGLLELKQPRMALEKSGEQTLNEKGIPMRLTISQLVRVL